MASPPRTHADPQTRSLLVGVSVVRWATILWAGVVLTVDVSDDQIDHPAISILELMTHIKGPDFPTGGVVCGIEGIKQYFQTGRGSVKLRAKEP